MGKFQSGDVVRIDGQQWTVKSWPKNDEGHFTAVRVNKQGGEVWTTLHTGAVDPSVDPVFESVDVELVKPADGPVVSTAGALPADDTAEAVAE